MDANEFKAYKDQGCTHVPVTLEISLGEHSPLEVYEIYANERDSYLLESLSGWDSQDRFSFIGLPCKERIEIKSGSLRHYQDSQVSLQEDSIDLVAYLHQFHSKYVVAEIPGLPRLNGGLVGFFAYECIRYFEPRLQHRLDTGTTGQAEADIPDVILLVSHEIIIHDHLSNTTTIVVITPASGANAYQQGCDRLTQIHTELKSRLQASSKKPTLASAPVDESHWPKPRSGLCPQEHRSAIERIKQYIHAGDVMQVVLSRSMSMPYSAPSIEIYRQMRTLNPSPYMYYFNFGEFQLTGSSPETLVRVQGDIATLRPLAGTRHRGDNPEHDAELAQELLADEKERAEHLMLIDLGRNDLGRVCQIGSVVTTEKMKVEYYSHVMHIVSNVIGSVKPGCSSFDVLKAAFPAGTLTGAPKIRAMEIIDELEPVARGFYGGAVGYFAWNHSMNLAITIRTAVIKDGCIYYQAGGGIVGDSVPEVEWQETVNKGKVILQAVAAAQSV